MDKFTILLFLTYSVVSQGTTKALRTDNYPVLQSVCILFLHFKEHVLKVVNSFSTDNG